METVAIIIVVLIAIASLIAIYVRFILEYKEHDTGVSVIQGREIRLMQVDDD